MLERDLILRLVKDLSRVLARIAGLKAAGQKMEAVNETETAAASLLGLDFTLVRALDSAVLASRLKVPERILGLACLCRERGLLAEEDRPLQEELTRKAVELWLEAGAGGAELPDEALLLIASQKAGSLGTRHESLRRALVGP